MSTASETPVLDTLAAMTVDSLERCGLPPDTLILTRIAALAASDAPPISYLAHVGQPHRSPRHRHRGGRRRDRG